MSDGCAGPLELSPSNVPSFSSCMVQCRVHRRTSKSRGSRTRARTRLVVALRQVRVAVDRVVEGAEVDAVARDVGLAVRHRDEVFDEVGGVALHVGRTRPRRRLMSRAEAERQLACQRRVQVCIEEDVRGRERPGERLVVRRVEPGGKVTSLTRRPDVAAGDAIRVADVRVARELHVVVLARVVRRRSPARPCVRRRSDRKRRRGAARSCCRARPRCRRSRRCATRS